ncbi:MAG TPA: hypothetical protein VIM11_26955 [Tepidisphaeraceae bacterium]
MICRLAMSLIVGWGGWCLAQASPTGPNRANDQNAVQRPMITVGPIKVTAANASMHRAIMFGHELRRVNTTTLVLNVTVDPDVVVPFISDFKIDALVDQSGHPIKGDIRKGVDNFTFTRNQINLPIEMPDLPAEVTDISRIEFSFNASVAKTEIFELTDLRPNHTTTHQSPAGDTVSLTYHTTPEGFSVNMQADLKSDDPETRKNMSRAFAAASVRVLDGSGKVFNSFGGSTSSSAGHIDHTSSYRVGQGTQNVSLGPPVKIVFNVPLSLTSTPVTGEFKELALP